MHGKDPPDDLSPWLGDASKRYDLYAIGTQEACRSIEMSLLLPSKAKWESRLRETLGSEYVCVATHTLAAIHLALFARRSLMGSIRCIRTAHVATGIANTLGNKGGVGISVAIGRTSLLLVNSHLAAHQNAVEQRNADYLRIDSQMPLRPAGVALPFVQGGSPNLLRPTARTSEGAESQPVASAAYDVCVWLGDLNYRIQGNRAVVDSLLAPPSATSRGSRDWQGEAAHWQNMCAVLLANDQLRQESVAGRVFAGFEEALITFRPTYKYDKDSAVYDTSDKCRIPAFTDRVLFRCAVPDRVEVLRYDACQQMRTSDHRPVFVELRVAYEPGIPPMTSEERARERRRNAGREEVTTVQSTVCSVM
jgi:phosphatidylinositol-bisphosphatase